jgi:hypothetical protein
MRAPSSVPEPLAGLHEVVMPSPVSYAPQTVGWLVLAAVSVLLLGWLAWRTWRHARANRYRKVALAEIDRIEAALRGPTGRLAAVPGVNDVLKRTALTAWPRAEVASLGGEGWLAFLDETAGGEAFRRGPGRVLADRVYAPAVSPPAEGETAALLGLARHWVRRHRPPDGAHNGRGPDRGGERKDRGLQRGRS